jgi:branched-chain amino acid transport system permease protein
MTEKYEKINRTGNPFGQYLAYALLTAFLLLLPWLGVGRYFIHVCILILTYIMATSSLRTVYISGQASVGHAAFMGIGAYTSAVLSMRLGWTPWVTIPVGALAAMIVAIAGGYFFSKLRAVYFSMVTLFFGVAIEAVMRSWVSLTGGRSGLVGFPGLGAIDLPVVGEVNFAVSKVPYYYLLLVLTFLTLLALYRLERSRTGMNWMAIAQSPVVATSIGISETKFRVLAFAVGCFFAGLAGSAYAHYSGVLSSSSFSLMPSIYLVIYMLLGGMGHFAGPIIGVIVLVAIPEFFRSLKEYAPFIFGGIMLLVIFFMPQGLAGLSQSLRPWFQKPSEKALRHP